MSKIVFLDGIETVLDSDNFGEYYIDINELVVKKIDRSDVFMMRYPPFRRFV